jgi:hypothetical protein
MSPDRLRDSNTPQVPDDVLRNCVMLAYDLPLPNEDAIEVPPAEAALLVQMPATAPAQDALLGPYV